MRIATGTGTWKQRRPAFTLIELLVVIAIIAVVAALAAGAVFQMIDTQHRNNTVTKLQTLDKILAAQLGKVSLDASKENPSPAAFYLANGDPDRAKVIWKTLRLMEAFPISYAEIQNPQVYSNVPGFGQPYIPFSSLRKNMPTYQGKLKNTTSQNPQTESAACLLMALQQNRGVLTLDPQSVKMADTDGDGMNEIVDDWSTAVRFFRFPTGNSDLINSNPNPNAVNKDLLDPLGKLTAPDWINTQQAAIFHNLKFQNLPQPPNRFGVYTLSVIVSAGSNQQFGFALPPDDTMAELDSRAFDNIYSYRLRLGGSGN